MTKNILSGRKLIKRADFRKILVCSSPTEMEWRDMPA